MWVYRRTNPVLARVLKIALVLLRVLGLTLLALVLARPLFSFSYVSKMEPEVALLIDNSASMKLEDTPVPRAVELDSILSSPLFGQLKEKAKLRYFLFSDSLQELKSRPDNFDFTGRSTSLSAALQKLQTRYPELLAAVLISDGGHNSGLDPASIAGQLDFPVYTIGVGSEELPFDLALSDLEYPEQIYVGTPAVVQFAVSGSGVSEQKLKVGLSEAGKPVAEKEVTISGQGSKQKVKFELTPKEEGIHYYQLALPHRPGEISYQNNQRKFSMRVAKEKIKVLCMAGNLTWEYHFFKRFLESQDNLAKTYVVVDRSKALEGRFPQKRAELDSFDLLMLVSPGLAFLSGREELLEDFVLKQNKSLLLILDDNFFSTAPTSPKLKILPFDPKRLSVSYSQFNLSLAQPAESNPLLRLSEESEENQKLWQELPPFLGILVPGTVNLEAKILATSPPLAQALGGPAMITREFGRGKVMATLAFPFWRWDFVLLGLGRSNPAYTKFWSNAIRWLTTQKAHQEFQLATDKLVYKAGEKIEFEAAYLDELGDKVTGGEVRLKLENASTKDKSELTLNLNLEKDYIGTLNFLPPGDYRAEASYLVDEKSLARAKTEFQVEEYSLEAEALIMNRQLLSQMSEFSGGRFYTFQNYQKLTEDLKLAGRTVEKEKSFELWNQPILLILAITFLSLEWFLRKRQQLP